MGGERERGVSEGGEGRIRRRNPLPDQPVRAVVAVMIRTHVPSDNTITDIRAALVAALSSLPWPDVAFVIEDAAFDGKSVQQPATWVEVK